MNEKNQGVSEAVVKYATQAKLREEEYAKFNVVFDSVIWISAFVTRSARALFDQCVEKVEYQKKFFQRVLLEKSDH